MRVFTFIFCVTIGMVMIFGTAARAAFLPTDISGLQLWLDASDLNGNGSADPSSGTAVSTWVDKSGQSHNATQATSANQPLIENSQINGQATVRFDGVFDNSTDDFLTTVGYRPSLTSGYTLFVVQKYSTLNNGSYISTANPTTGVDGDIVRLLNTSDPGQGSPEPGTPGIRVFSGFNGTSGFYDASGMDGPNTPDILAATNSSVTGIGGTLNVYLNGATLLGPTSVVRSSTNATGHDLDIGIGGDPSTGAFPYQGDIAEILIYNSVLTSDQANEVGSYLQSKYGISGDYLAPEPASMTLLLLGGAALLGRRRRA